MRIEFEYKGRVGWAEFPPDDTTWEEVFQRIKWQIDVSYEGRIADGNMSFDPHLNVRWKWHWDKREQ